MADFVKFNGYDVKDASAGKALTLTGQDLALLNATGTPVSQVTLPSSSGGVAYYEGVWDHYNDNNTAFHVYDEIYISDLDALYNLNKGDIVNVKGNDNLQVALAVSSGDSNFAINGMSTCYISTLKDTILICTGVVNDRPIFCILNDPAPDEVSRSWNDPDIGFDERIGYLLSRLKYATEISPGLSEYDIGYKLVNNSNSQVTADSCLFMRNDKKAIAIYSYWFGTSTVTHIAPESIPPKSGITPKVMSINDYGATDPSGFTQYMCPLAFRFDSSASVNDNGYYPIADSDLNHMMLQNKYNIVVVFDVDLF